MKGKIKGMATCEVCGRDFPLVTEETYVARDAGIAGIGAALVHEEPKWYDAIDCPHCGCQNVLQDRKRFLAPEDVECEDSECGDCCTCEGDSDGE